MSGGLARFACFAVSLMVLPMIAARNGHAIPVSQVASGQLLLGEIMANPAGDETLQEWFEIVNTLPLPVDMNGMIVTSNNGSFSVSGTGHTVSSGGIALFARTSDAALNGNLPPVTFAWGQALTLTNTNGHLSLQRPDGGQIVSASWTQTTNGFSRQLASGTAPVFGQADFVAANTGQLYDSSIYQSPAPSPPNFGTPGVVNSQAMAVSGISSLLISEIMANPAGDDSLQEWFEVYNPQAIPVDLDGLVVNGINGSFTVSGGSHVINPGEFFVFARSDDPKVNGGLPRVDYAWGQSLSLPNTNGQLSLVDKDGNLIVSASWTNAASGFSRELVGGTGPQFGAADFNDTSGAQYTPANELPGPTVMNYGTPGVLDAFDVSGVQSGTAIAEPSPIAVLVCGLAVLCVFHLCTRSMYFASNSR